MIVPGAVLYTGAAGMLMCSKTQVTAIRSSVFVDTARIFISYSSLVQRICRWRDIIRDL